MKELEKESTNLKSLSEAYCILTDLHVNGASDIVVSAKLHIAERIIDAIRTERIWNSSVTAMLGAAYFTGKRHELTSALTRS